MGYLTAGGGDRIVVGARTIHHRDDDVGAGSGSRHRRGDTVCTVGTIGHIVREGVAVGISDGVGVHIAGGASLGDGLDAIARGTG